MTIDHVPPGGAQAAGHSPGAGASTPSIDPLDRFLATADHEVDEAQVLQVLRVIVRRLQMLEAGEELER